MCSSGTCVVAVNEVEGRQALTTVWDWIIQLNASNFAGHNDWRLPSEAGVNGPPFACYTCDPRELETLLTPEMRLASSTNNSDPCGTPDKPCMDPIIGPVAIELPPGALGFNFYWGGSADTMPDLCTPEMPNCTGDADIAFGVYFGNGLNSGGVKWGGALVRAVR